MDKLPRKHLDKEHFDNIQSGKKEWELRVPKPKSSPTKEDEKGCDGCWEEVRRGSMFIFFCRDRPGTELLVRVEKVVKFASVADALEWCYAPRVVPGRSFEDAKKVYSTIYPDSMVRKYGVVAIKIDCTFVSD